MSKKEKILNFFKDNIIFTNMAGRISLLRHFSLADWLDFKKAKLFWLVSPYTMVGYHRLNNAYQLAKSAEEKKLAGALVECGSWKGGCIAAMAYAAKQAAKRKIYAFDSFQGLPEPKEIDGPSVIEYADGKKSGKLATINKCVAKPEEVEAIFNKLKINKSKTMIIPGWLQDTLPSALGSIGAIAILRLDVDWYESTKYCLENLYDNVAAGGYIIIDDYGQWPGCRQAVDEFIASRGIKAGLIKIDYAGMYFIKP